MSTAWNERTEWILQMLWNGSWAMLIAFLFVRLVKPKTPAMQRLACVVVVLHGWCISPVTIAIPWYEATTTANASGPSPIESIQDSPRSAIPSERMLAVTPAAPTNDEPKATTPGNWLQAGFLLLWLAGASILVLFAFHQQLKLWIDFPQWRRAPCEWERPWRALLAANHSAAVPMYVSANQGPMLCLGPGATCLVVPEGSWKALSNQERDLILRHELSHHLHRDLAKNWGLAFLSLPYWFHPAVWWSLRTFAQAGEVRCDADAAQSAEDRDRFVSMLGKLVSLRQSTVSWVGQCAHAHPVLLRMKRLTDGPLQEDSKMMKFLRYGLLGGLLLMQSVDVQLVAQESDAPTSLDAIKLKMEAYDERIKGLKDLEEQIKTHGETLKSTIDEQVQALMKLRNSPEQLSEAATSLAKPFQSGTEAEQLSAIEEVAKHQPREEAVLICGLVASESSFVAVRQAAIKTACTFGKEGYPAIAIAYEQLNTTDRVYLLSQIREFPVEDRTVLMALMADEADSTLMTQLIAETLPDDRRLVLLGSLAKKEDDAVINQIIEAGKEMKGEQGLLVLYAAAKAKQPQYVLSAVKAARTRGPEAYPVIAAAGRCNDPAVRGEVVRAALQWGGEVGQFIVEKAKAEPDESLRKAADDAIATIDEAPIQ